MAVSFRRPAWTPQRDVDQALAYSDPVTQNRALINAARNQWTSSPVLPEWSDYNAVLAGRGARLNPNADPAEPGLPAGYTEGQLDTENADYLQGGRRPRWAGAQNLPGSEQNIRGSLAGLQRALRG